MLARVGTVEGGAMGAYASSPVASQTRVPFGQLCVRTTGAGMGGCWCCWFHNATMAERRAAGGNDWRGYKERRVREGRAHAALVFDGETAVGWCEYGSPA